MLTSWKIVPRSDGGCWLCACCNEPLGLERAMERSEVVLKHQFRAFVLARVLECRHCGTRHRHLKVATVAATTAAEFEAEYLHPHWHPRAQYFDARQGHVEAGAKYWVVGEVAAAGAVVHYHDFPPLPTTRRSEFDTLGDFVEDQIAANATLLIEALQLSFGGMMGHGVAQPVPSLTAGFGYPPARFPAVAQAGVGGVPQAFAPGGIVPAKERRYGEIRAVLPPARAATCDTCGASGTGNYCANCGKQLR